MSGRSLVDAVTGVGISAASEQRAAYRPTSYATATLKALADEVRKPWRDRALCRATDPGLFYGEGSGDQTTLNAKQVCALCPVTKECLEFALKFNEEFGVWGGLTEEERRRVKRRRQREARRNSV